MTGADGRDEHQAKKALVRRHWEALDAADPDLGAGSAMAVIAADGWWHGHAPVGSVQGPEAIRREAWEPIRRALADLERETFVFFAGTSNGRVDGDVALDGRNWVTGTGVLRGRFEHDYLSIPANRAEVAIRWGGSAGSPMAGSTRRTS